MAMIEDFLARHKIGGTWRDSMQTAITANAESARRAHARNLDNMWRARNLRFAQDSAKRNEKNAVRLEKQINAGTALWKDNLGKISKQFDKLASQKLDPVTETRALRNKIEKPNSKNKAALGDKIEKPKSNLSKLAKLGAATTLGVGAAGFLASSASAREREDYSAKEKQGRTTNPNGDSPPESGANSTPDNPAPITPPADNKDLTKLSEKVDDLMKPSATTTVADGRQPTRPSDNAINIPDKTDREISTLFDNTEKLVEDHAKAVQEAIRAASEETEKTIEGTTGKGVKGSAVSATPTTLTNNAVGVVGATPTNNMPNSSGPTILNPDFGVAGKGGGTGSATGSSGMAFGASPSRIKEGRASGDMPTGIGASQGSTGRATDSKSLARNKQEAFNAARAEGLSSHDAKILVANMEGESLRNPSAHNQDYNKYGQPVHMAQGIVQWDPFRSARIAKEFGKQPKDMTVAEQTKASIWEMKNFYPKAWSVFSDPNATKEQKMWAVVKHYENPARPEADTNKRLGYLQNLKVREDGSFADATRISAQASNVKPYGGYAKTTNADGSTNVTAGQGGYKSSVFNNPEEAKVYLRSVSAIGSSAAIMKKYGYDSINDMNDEAALKAATAFYKYNQDAKANGLVPATLNSAVRLPLPGMPGGFANKQNSAHAGTMAFDVGFKGVMQNTGNNIYSFENYAKKEGLFSGRSIYGNHEGHHFSLVPDKHNPFKGNYDATGRPLDLDKMRRATVSGFVATYPKDKVPEAKQTEAKSETKSEVARYTPPVVPNMTTPSEDIKPAGAGENYDAPKSETKADTGGASGNTETSNSAGGKDTFEDHSENDINFKKPG